MTTIPPINWDDLSVVTSLTPDILTDYSERGRFYLALLHHAHCCYGLDESCSHVLRPLVAAASRCIRYGAEGGLPSSVDFGVARSVLVTLLTLETLYNSERSV